jgi:hypothetical protein
MGSAKRGQASEREQLQALLHIEARARRWQEHAAAAQTRVGHGSVLLCMVTTSRTRGV